MNENPNSRLSKRLGRTAIAIVTFGTFALPAAYAMPSSHLIVVPPTDLPELARQTGEAMLLYEALDGRTVLYIEQNNGARVAMFDVTDPSHVRGEGSVSLDGPGAFDFVSTLGNRAEMVRFRQGEGSAVLDLRKAKDPTLKRAQGLTLQGPTMALGNDGFTVTSQDNVVAQSSRDYLVVDTANAQDLNRVFDVKRVHVEIANNATGTTFLLAEDGLYLIRRPAVEAYNRNRELIRIQSQ
jgi:hypothetical protein